MKKDLSKIDGTIAKVLTDHKEELFGYIDLNQVQKLQKRVDELLGSEELSKNKAVAEAKLNLDEAKHNRNRYYSILMAYLTGMKVSI